MTRSAIVLAGGSSNRLSFEKGCIELLGKPLVMYVIEKIFDLVDEVLVVTKNESQSECYGKVLEGKATLLVDKCKIQAPLVGALRGLETAVGELSLLVPCDTPFISKRIVRVLFEISDDKDCIVPKWPNGHIEPLQAVYRTSSACTAARRAIDENRRSLNSMISLMRRRRYISTEYLRTIDKDLLTFFNINTKADLSKAKIILEMLHQSQIEDTVSPFEPS